MSGLSYKKTKTTLRLAKHHFALPLNEISGQGSKSDFLGRQNFMKILMKIQKTSSPVSGCFSILILCANIILIPRPPFRQLIKIKMKDEVLHC